MTLFPLPIVKREKDDNSMLPFNSCEFVFDFLHYSSVIYFNSGSCQRCQTESAVVARRQRRLAHGPGSCFYLIAFISLNFSQKAVRTRLPRFVTIAALADNMTSLFNQRNWIALEIVKFNQSFLTVQYHNRCRPQKLPSKSNSILIH